MITLTPEELEEYNKNIGIRTNFSLDSGIIEQFFNVGALLEYGTPQEFGMDYNNYIEEYRNPSYVISEYNLLVIEYAITETEEGEKTWIALPEDMSEVTIGNYLWYRLSLSSEPPDPVYLFYFTGKYKLDTRIEDNIVSIGAIKQTLQQDQLNNFKNGNIGITIKGDRGEVTRLMRVIESVPKGSCYFDFYSGFINQKHLMFRGILADGGINVDPQNNTATLQIVDFTSPMRDVDVDDFFKLDDDWLTNRTVGFAVNFAMDKWGVADKSLISTKPLGTDYGVQEYGIIPQVLAISQDLGSHIIGVFKTETELIVRKWDKVTYDGDGNPIWQTLGRIDCESYDSIQHIGCETRPDLFGFQFFNGLDIYYILINRLSLDLTIGLLEADLTSIETWIETQYSNVTIQDRQTFLGFDENSVFSFYCGVTINEEIEETVDPIIAPPFTIYNKTLRILQFKRNNGNFINTDLISNIIIWQNTSSSINPLDFKGSKYGIDNTGNVCLFCVDNFGLLIRLKTFREVIFNMWSEILGTEQTGADLEYIRFTKQGYLVQFGIVQWVNQVRVHSQIDYYNRVEIVPNTDSLIDCHFSKTDKIYRWSGTALVEVADLEGNNILSVWGGNYTGQKADRDYILFSLADEGFGALSLDEVTIEDFSVFEGKSLYDTLALIAGSYNFYFGQTTGRIYLTDSLLSDGFVFSYNNVFSVDESKLDYDGIINRIIVLYDGITGTKDVYASLPVASSHEDEYWVVLNDTLVSDVIDKAKGTYYSDGTSWSFYNSVTDGKLERYLNDTASQTQYGRKELKIELPHIKRHDIAENIADGYLDIYVNPYYSFSLSIKYSPHFEILDGGRVDLGDIAFGSVSRILDLSHDYTNKKTTVKGITTEDPLHSWFGINEFGSDSEFG